MFNLIAFVAGFATCYFIFSKPFHFIMEYKYPETKIIDTAKIDEYEEFEKSEGDIKNPNTTKINSVSTKANELISLFTGGDDGRI